MDQTLHDQVRAHLLSRVQSQIASLPNSLSALTATLIKAEPYAPFDEARDLAEAAVTKRREELLTADTDTRRALLAFAAEFLGESQCTPILRRLAKDPDLSVRRRVQTLIRDKGIREVALPLRKGGSFDATGWSRGTEKGALSNHEQGTKIQQAHGLPPLKTVADVRKLLKIPTPGQLGYLLLASEINPGGAGDEGPYVTFEIDKRNGKKRLICAPKRQLRAVQRRILSEILGKVPVDDAAHGFVPGRSTLSNALCHVGKKILVQFDLTDFFPTIHYFRVLGLFVQLGYYLEEGRFSTKDKSRAVAPVLARLCTFAEDPDRFGTGTTPQGAPTSPALSNLVCRGLDKRLSGLATTLGGTYTRYADDLTLSFGEEPDLGKLRWWVDQICQQEGFVVNQAKFRITRSSARQVVTGVVVNEKPRIPREERRQFRALLHNCRIHGLASQARGKKDLASYLWGFASYIHMVNPDEGKELLAQVAALTQGEAE